MILEICNLGISYNSKYSTGACKVIIFIKENIENDLRLAFNITDLYVLTRTGVIRQSFHS